MRCGVGDYSFNLAKAIIAYSNVRVGVLTSTQAEDTKLVEDIEVFPVIKKWGLYEINNVVKVINKWKPDIVHIQYPTQGYGRGLLPWIIPLIAFCMQKKVVQTWHEGYSRRDILKIVLKSIVPGCLVFVRPHYRENLHSQLRWVLWCKKTLFIPNASAIPYAELDQTEKKEFKKQYLNGQKRLVVFFGFIYPHKGVELLFEIADAANDQIVIAGEVDDKSEYFLKISNYATSKPWTGKVVITGYLPVSEIANLLAVADAVILPFRLGGGEWNTSLHGAILNGAFVITTSLKLNGYDIKSNVYYAKVNDTIEMKSALKKYANCKRNFNPDIDLDGWQGIARQHFLLYSNIINS